MFSVSVIWYNWLTDLIKVHAKLTVKKMDSQNWKKKKKIVQRNKD